MGSCDLYNSRRNVAFKDFSLVGAGSVMLLKVGQGSLPMRGGLLHTYCGYKMHSTGEGRPMGREESSCLHFSCLATYMNFISQWQISESLKVSDTKHTQMNTCASSSARDALALPGCAW